MHIGFCLVVILCVSAFEDYGHHGWFVYLDKNRDGYLSLDEFSLFPRNSEEWFMYYAVHRKQKKTDKVVLDYETFMWLYRERYLVLTNPDKLRSPPRRFYQFPGGWPGIRISEIEKITKATPRIFWKKYVDLHKPVLFKGVQRESIAFKKWSEIDYLSTFFGKFSAKVELKKEARGNMVRGTGMPKTPVTIDSVLKGEHSEFYVVSLVPHAMQEDVLIPSFMLCGERDDENVFMGLPAKGTKLSGLMKSITQLEESGLWIANGSTRSEFHYDKENIVNCLVAGNSKSWLLIDTRKYAHVLNWVRGNRYDSENDLRNNGSDWLGINVDSIDLNLHDYLLNHVEFQKVTQEPGDCLYLPYSMLHFAAHEKEDTLHVGVMWMWEPDVRFDKKCEFADKVIERGLPMSAFDFTWFYGGFGAIPQGMPDPLMIKNLLKKNKSLKTNLVMSENHLSEREKESLILISKINRHVKAKISVPRDLLVHLAASLDDDSLYINRGLEYISRNLSHINEALQQIRSLASSNIIY